MSELAAAALPELVFTPMAERIRAQARERPDHPALIHGERRMSYGELDAAMDRVAATLQALGVGAQEVVAICALSSIEYVAVLCGALRAGIVTTPLAPFSTADSLAMMIGDCGARVLFIDAGVGAQLAPVMDRIVCPHVSLDGSDVGQPFADWLGPKDAVPEVPEPLPEWSYNIIYS